MKKYQVSIHFTMDDEFMSFIPEHRTYIDSLIEKEIVDQYVVSMESQRVWITVSAKNKKEVRRYVTKSPLNKYWTFEIDELVVVDGQLHRLPAVRLN